MSGEMTVIEDADASTGSCGPSEGGTASSLLQVGEYARLLRALEALSDPVRLEIVGLLSGNGPTCSCDLEAPLARSQPTISHHTKVLSDVGLILGERRGKWTWWSLNGEMTRQLQGLLEKLFGGNPNAVVREIQSTDEDEPQVIGETEEAGALHSWT